MVAMRFAVICLLVAACGGGPEGEPAGGTAGPPGDEPTSGGEVEPAATGFAIDGEVVDRAAFEAFRARLQVDEDPSMTAELASPEGGYGGFEAVYDAVDADGGRYRYTVVEQHGSGGVQRSESLDRLPD